MSTRQARRRQQRSGQSNRARQRRKQQTPWYLSSTGLLGMVVGIIVVVAAIIYFGQNKQKQTVFDSKPVSPSVLSAVTNPPAGVVNSVGSGGIDDPWTALPAKGPKLSPSGSKPELFAWLAEFCPYCAAERWGLINAIDRFGHLSSVYTMESSGTDVYPNTRTFTLRHATFSSSYLTLATRENETRNRATLQNPTSSELAVLNKYDNSQGGLSFPFIDLANKAEGNLPANENEGVFRTDPSNTSSKPLSWKQITADLSSPSTPQARAVFGDANWITAGICRVTGNKPHSVCTAAPIPALESKLPFK